MYHVNNFLLFFSELRGLAKEGWFGKKLTFPIKRRDFKGLLNFYIKNYKITEGYLGWGLRFFDFLQGNGKSGLFIECFDFEQV